MYGSPAQFPGLLFLVGLLAQKSEIVTHDCTRPDKVFGHKDVLRSNADYGNHNSYYALFRGFQDSCYDTG